jgi:hypothetical protein
MTTIGGKSRKAQKPTKPQVVVQAASHVNQFAVLGTDEVGCTTIAWSGDPEAATKFDSKYAAKTRIRELLDIPASRVFHTLEKSL